MGRASREKPARLAEKLLQIRNALGLSQSGMVKKLGLEGASYRNYISDFENGMREPPLPALLKYAKVAGVYVDVLIDDGLRLPKRIPAKRRKLEDK